MKQLREFITTGMGTEGSLLIVKTIYDTLIEEVAKKQIPEDVVAIWLDAGSIPGSSIDVDLVTPDSMDVREVAEGGPFPIDVVKYETFNMKPKKVGVQCTITKEMVEDGKWDLIDHHAKVAGVRMAEYFTDRVINDALENATSSTTSVASMDVATITRAMQYLEDLDYTPTDIFMGPTVVNDIRNLDAFADAAVHGTDEMQRTGMIGQIYGVNVHVISARLINTLYAYMIDRAHAIIVAEKRPVTVENYDQVTHDLSGLVVSRRIKVRYLRADAIVKMVTT
jgi:hypothetical protein